MANKINKNERFDKIRDKINKKPVAKKRVKNDDNVETSSFMSEIFPVVIVLCLLVGFGVFYFLFNTYKEVLVVDDDGYFLNTGTLILGSKKTENDADLIDFVAVNENDLIYKKDYEIIMLMILKMQLLIFNILYLLIMVYLL